MGSNGWGCDLSGMNGPEVYSLALWGTERLDSLSLSSWSHTESVCVCVCVCVMCVYVCVVSGGGCMHFAVYIDFRSYSPVAIKPRPLFRNMSV